MKVLLIAPFLEDTTQKKEGLYPSSALLYLGSFLRANNHEPILLDFNINSVHDQSDKLEYCQAKILDYIQEYNPKLIGLGCLFSGAFGTVLEFAKTIRSNYPDIKIATGGIHPTTYPRKILENCSDFDFVAIGEGEGQMLALANCIENDNLDDVAKINQFAYRTDQGDVHVNTEFPQLLNMDELPMPAWDLIDLTDYQMDLDHFYNPKQLKITNRVPVFSSRGCPLPCNFCDMFLVMGKKHRRSSASRMVDELEFLNKNYGMNYFSIMDDNLTLQKTHILEICDEINRRNLNIQWETPNGVMVNSLNDEIVSAMAEAGLIHTWIAIEHGSEYIRNLIIGKGLKREKIFEASELLKKYKIMTGGFFIMGFPEETHETLSETEKMMNELKLDRMGVSTAIPFPGTKLFKQVIQDNLLIESVDYDNLWKTPISHAQSGFVIKPYNMSIEELVDWRGRLHAVNDKYKGYNKKQWEAATSNGATSNGATSNIVS